MATVAALAPVNAAAETFTVLLLVVLMVIEVLAVVVVEGTPIDPDVVVGATELAV